MDPISEEHNGSGIPGILPHKSSSDLSGTSVLDSIPDLNGKIPVLAPKTTATFEDPDPSRPNIDATLPPLVRLDGRTLKAPEARYPAMSYRENEHETWPDWAIERATKRYPDLPKKIEESRQLVPDSPQDLTDPDYFELPENPTFKDLFSHGKWKQKKYGQL